MTIIYIETLLLIRNLNIGHLELMGTGLRN